MAVQDQLAVYVAAGVAVFGISWWLGNKLENVGGSIKQGVIDTGQAGADFFSGATGQERFETQPEIAFSLWELPDNTFIETEGAKILQAYTTDPGTNFDRSVPFPVDPPLNARTTTPDDEGFYSFDALTPGLAAGIELPTAWDRFWDDIGQKPALEVLFGGLF